jgi:hypothetical protein
MRCIEMNANVNDAFNVERSRERGAALITSLLVATLLLIVGGALILTTNLAHGLAIDSTTELQAYYAAEAGVNASVNVLRGNIASPAGTRATFRNAADNPTLNNWLTYDYTIDGVNVVQVNPTPAMAYAVDVSDPDNTPALQIPARLKVRVTGYGPNGSRKQMELMVSRFIFDFNPLATILMRGNDNGTSNMPTFAIGQSNAKDYSGYDQANPINSLPVFGVTHGNDFNQVTTEINSAQPNTVSGVDKVTEFSNGQLPTFLQSADNARAFLNTLEQQAVTNNRYFTTPPADFGTVANPKFTFIDGDATLVEGAGLLVVTGTLTSDGNVGFKGIVLVLGKGDFQRNGNGNSDLLGAIVIASFARTWPSSENNQPHPFLSPTFNTDGGGTGLVAYDSNEVTNALATNGLRSLGVREY